ncbi:putative Hydro-Lyase; similar to 3-isopropylmalate dehydratase and Aconitase [Cupriavidus taiwanensis]|uniref:aconitase family protein n=1 Tax=Cupriavidus taiwanensis TaxID=164546 RepID=UPI000E17D6FC|nr:aconitase family protein [Cupriavidus taiwanensis]SOZ20060.1 putative Hydro-Lyase; similar to 3-isopropylmalate dehydratase and Aconitase [Cupriavidus taiwanensis]SOZ33283.1 putative Hydro-Lyase; similar to 3-isopropylmalate dehydratase and Aconitase [Cupriavidus taiwanensis]SOZ48598.1 putative Hydro-Lyase; similar to 3-isopropylmalate dehydratase and Aconitase [Cupriavidus taiwanensis]
MSAIGATARILFLADSASAMTAQLQGQPMTLASAGALRDDVSTDEITPVPILTHYDDTLGRFPYTGYKVDGACPVPAGAIRDGGFAVTVAGNRYGKGSSREHSPAAEKLAGIRLVFARSFERIYRQNADNIGLFTSTDFSLLTRLEQGEAINADTLVAGRDALAAAILRHGGLLRFGQAHLSDVEPAPSGVPTGPQTLFEKIVQRHLLATPVTPARPVPGDGIFVRADWRFIHEYYTGMCAHMLHAAFGKPLQLRDADRIVVFEDHTSYVSESPAHVRGGLVDNVARMCAAQRDFVRDYQLRCHRTLTEDESRGAAVGRAAGISHAMMAERYALPGQVVVGTDSHTPHSGALGCVAFGVGTTDMANAFVTGAVRMTLPQCIRVRLDGALAPGVTAKDVVLQLLARADIKAGAGVGKVFEFTGPVVGAMSIDERATLTNMCAELGGFTGIVAPDAQTVRFLRERRGIDFEIEPWMRSDDGAAFAATLEIDCGTLEPMVARPGDPGNGMPLAALTRRVAVDLAYGGSCTAGKREDFDWYHEVLHWAVQRGLRLAPQVTLYLQFGTTDVRDYCIRQGYLETFHAIGARILQPSCGACANCGPGSSERPEQVTVSSINRNFPGRSGPGQVWLASPPTVAASAICGELVSFEELQRRYANGAA